jgi:hypothetical protein
MAVLFVVSNAVAVIFVCLLLFCLVFKWNLFLARKMFLTKKTGFAREEQAVALPENGVVGEVR